MNALLLLFFVLRAEPVDAPKTRPLVPIGKHSADQALTRCAACHTTATWSEVKFEHAKTGFPLKGRHARVDCRGCHAVDFTSPLPRQCAACHRDAHAGDLGARCESCHDESTWKSPFNAESHRRSNFPLVGAHAVIPCQECHFDMRDRRFARSTVSCTACHTADLMRTAGTAVDHVSLGFAQDCQQCHGAFAFRPARFTGHDTCMTIDVGSHAGIACDKCHSSLKVMSMAGTCSTRTVTCAGCHEHECMGVGGQTETDRQHQDVMGYRCNSNDCYLCHQNDVKLR